MSAFAPPAKRNDRGELLYEIDASHSRLSRSAISRGSYQDSAAHSRSKSPKRTPFRRTKARNLERTGSEDATKERNALEILRQLHRLGRKNLDWTPYSPTAGGIMKRDAAKAPHSVLHTVFSGGKWASNTVGSSSSSVRSRRTRSASPSPSVASSRKSSNNNLSGSSKRLARSQSPVGSLSISQLASPSKRGSSSPFLTELKANLQSPSNASHGLKSPRSVASPRPPSSAPGSPLLSALKSSSRSPSRGIASPLKSPVDKGFLGELNSSLRSSSPHLHSPRGDAVRRKSRQVVGFRGTDGGEVPRSTQSVSKFEYSIEVEQDGVREVLTQSLGDEKRNVKAKFYVAGFHLLKNKYITLVRNKSSILHRCYMKATKERLAREKLANKEQEPNYDYEDTEEAELLEKLHLIRQSCKFLGALHVRVNSRHDLVKLDACAHRHTHAHTLAVLHVFARNLRHRKFAVMVCTLRRLGRRGMEGLMGNARRRVRYRYFVDGASQWFFLRQTRRVVQILKRRSLYGKVIAQKRGNEAYAVQLRTKSLNFGLWASYLAQRRADKAKLQRQYALGRVAFLKAHSGAFGIRRWIHHMRTTRRTSPRRTAKFLRFTLLLNGYCALRGWRDSHAAHHHAFGSHTRRMQINAIAHILAWKERRQRHHTVQRNAFWKGVHSTAVKRLGYWRRLTASSLVRDRAQHSANARFRAKGLKKAVRNWRRRVLAHNQYRMERRRLGRAFDKVVVRRTGGSKMLDGRALLRRYLKSWVAFMFVRTSHFEENALRDKAIKRKKLRRYFSKLADATVFRPRFEETPLYRYIVDKGNRLSRHRMRVGMQALSLRMEAGRDRRADLRETYYVDKGVRQSLRGWRSYFKNLGRLRDRVYARGTRLHLQKAWLLFGFHVELSLQRSVVLRNMRQAADHKRLRHLAGLVFRGLILNHEDLLAEYERANIHYLSRFMRNGFRHAHTFRRIRRHAKHALVRVRKNHFQMFLDRWRQHMKLKRRARRALSHPRRPKLMKMMMAPSSGNRYYFAAWRKVARARGKIRVRSTAATSFMHHNYRLGASLERFLRFTTRCIRHRHMQSKLQEEHRYHALSRVVALLKKRGIARLGIGRRQHGFRRLDQVLWQEHADRLRKTGQKRLLLGSLRGRTKLSLRRHGRLGKHAERRRVKQLRAGWRALKKHTRLMMAEVHVHALRRRRIFEEWKEKYYHIHIWHSASKSIMFKNTAFLLKRAFREWKTDCAVERELEGYVEDRSDMKVSAALMRLRVFSRRTHKARGVSKRAHRHFLATLASCLVRELRLNVRAKRLEHEHMAVMDRHRNLARKRAAIQALIAMQIHRVSVKFHAFKQMDNLMFALKQVTNRARYARLLSHIATDAKLRKCWLRMRKVLNRSRYLGKKTEAACRETGKPAPWAFYVPVASIAQSEETCARFRRAYTKQMAVQGWFRYVTYCRKAERNQGERFDEWRIRWQKRQVLLKLLSYRSGRIHERHVDRATSKLRYDFALRRVVTKLTLNNFGKWVERQKQRLAVDKMKTVAKLKSMRLLQVAPDMAPTH